MVVYLVEYVNKHVFGIAESFLGLEGEGHDHVNDNDHAHEPTEDEDESALQSLIAHLIENSPYSCRRPSRLFFCSS